MRAIPDGPADAGRRLHRYWYRESHCQVRTGWQKKSASICVNLRLIFSSCLPCPRVLLATASSGECPRGQNSVHSEAKKINQKCSTLEPKIEKSKNFLSPFLTSSYLCQSCQNNTYFRLKSACSPNYRGALFYRRERIER